MASKVILQRVETMELILDVAPDDLQGQPVELLLASAVRTTIKVANPAWQVSGIYGWPWPEPTR
jgi:hypothetical protein